MRPTESFLEYRRTRDPRDFNTFYIGTMPRLQIVAEMLVRDVHVAEDLVQNTYIAAIDAMDGFDDERDVEAWLSGILLNRLRRTTRSFQREQRLLRQHSERQGESTDEHTPEDTARFRELTRIVQARLSGVREPYREVLRLRLLQGESTVEVGRILDRSTSTVRTSSLADST